VLVGPSCNIHSRHQSLAGKDCPPSPMNRSRDIGQARTNCPLYRAQSLADAAASACSMLFETKVYFLGKVGLTLIR
jgi:hypothetical protein